MHHKKVSLIPCSFCNTTSALTNNLRLFWWVFPLQSQLENGTLSAEKQEFLTQVFRKEHFANASHMTVENDIF